MPLERIDEERLYKIIDFIQMVIPDTYREYFLTLGTANIIDKATADILANGVKLRNVLAHQYLDIRWEKIKQFLSSEWKAYEVLIDCVRRYW